jgi:hypothetical protein
MHSHVAISDQVFSTYFACSTGSQLKLPPGDENIHIYLFIYLFMYRSSNTNIHLVYFLFQSTVHSTYVFLTIFIL